MRVACVMVACRGCHVCGSVRGCACEGVHVSKSEWKDWGDPERRLTGESREEFNRGRWEGEGWEKVPEGGRWKVGGKRVVCANCFVIAGVYVHA